MTLAASLWRRGLPDVLSGMHVGRRQNSAGQICHATCAQNGSGDVFAQKLWPTGFWGVIFCRGEIMSVLVLVHSAFSENEGHGHVSVCAHVKGGGTETQRWDLKLCVTFSH